MSSKAAPDFEKSERSTSPSNDRLAAIAIRPHGAASKFKKLHSAPKALSAAHDPKKLEPDRDTVSFLSLPGELCNQIFHHILHIGYLEIAPSGDAAVEAYHLQRLGDDIVPRLKLLRVNKQVHREAASFFYRENEFRFTGKWGHEVLEAFCRTIGRVNTRLLQKVTEHITWTGTTLVPNRDNCFLNHKGRKDLSAFLDRWYLKKKGHFSKRDIAHGMGVYPLVLPSTLALDQANCAMQRAHSLLAELDSGKHTNSRAVLVLLDNMDNIPLNVPKRWSRPELIGLIFRRDNDREAPEALLRHAEKKGWVLRRVSLDRRGRYSTDKDDSKYAITRYSGLA